MQKSVYDALTREKRTGESFTQLFRRLLDQRGGVEELAGAWGRGPARRERAALRLLRRGAGRR